MTGSPILSYTKLCVVILFWSGNFIVGRAVNGAVPPFTLAFVRWIGAFLIVLPFAWRYLRTDRDILIRQWRPVVYLGLTGVASFNAFAYSGLRFTTATNGLLLQAAVPALVLLFSRLFFAQRAPFLQIAGVGLSMAGVAVIVLRGNLAAMAGLSLNIGDLLILAGVVCWSLYTCFLRFRPDCHPLSFLAATFLIGAAAMAPLSVGELLTYPAIPLNPGVIGAFAYVALFPSLFAYILYNSAVKDLGAGPAGQAITLMPLFGAVLAAILLNEPLQGFHLTGMVLILGGIFLSAMGIGLISL